MWNIFSLLPLSSRYTSLHYWRGRPSYFKKRRERAMMEKLKLHFGHFLSKSYRPVPTAVFQQGKGTLENMKGNSSLEELTKGSIALAEYHVHNVVMSMIRPFQSCYGRASHTLDNAPLHWLLFFYSSKLHETWTEDIWLQY